MTFHIKKGKMPGGFEYDYLEPELSDIVLCFSSIARDHWKQKRLGKKIMDPYTGKEALDPLDAISPSFMAKISDRWSPVAWAHAFKDELRKENVEIVRKIGNETFYRATHLGSNQAYHTFAHVVVRMNAWKEASEARTMKHEPTKP